MSRAHEHDDMRTIDLERSPDGYDAKTVWDGEHIAKGETERDALLAVVAWLARKARSAEFRLGVIQHSMAAVFEYAETSGDIHQIVFGCQELLDVQCQDTWEVANALAGVAPLIRGVFPDGADNSPENEDIDDEDEDSAEDVPEVLQ